MKYSQWGRKAFVLTISLFSLFMLGGCWSSLELNERIFVRLMVVDKSEEGVQLTLGFPLSNRMIPGMAESSGQAGGKAYSYVTKSGADIGQAFRKIQINLSRKINFGQTRVIVVGRELAEEGIEPVLEFAARHPSLYINSNLYVTTGEAKDVSTIATVSERFPSDILTAFARLHSVIDTTCKDFMAANYNGGDIAVSLLRLKTQRIETEKEKEQIWVEPVGAAIFKQGKMVGTLNIKEMRGGLWILNKLRDAEITIHSPTDGKDVSFMIRRMKTHIKPLVGRNRVLIRIYSKGEAEVISSDSGIDLSNPQELRRIEHSLSAEVTKRIGKAIGKSIDLQSDAFHFGSYIDWKYPREWKRIKPRWRDIYGNSLDFAARVDVKIKRLGTIKEPVGKTLGPKTKEES
ncbi:MULTISPECIES: Ger(x)C family spore germination protein [Paenibacillus]|uniref:Spore germination protein YndF n=1 Tax=Paenibacillus albilobatus TaxID=2716884 RepID=A0A920CAL2_9BACL|nr:MULTISPECIES: Ger(x)C family spore germination protein [Paenibacillus]GIO30189.1 spore germination protein YndF [Paenibacillus albilobatus]